ncbi:MAG: RusA family crossover junction endodeoxyribonuclease [Candidatus Aenigmarchaeota archaeon]|nr:RusA family crossover junction endodeoxyribonuclease [Candidatus Aenigmarchaeota archaeon]
MTEKNYKLIVDGKPPKKHGEKSMWNQKTEAERLITLRKHAKEKLGDDKPLSGNIKLEITVFLPDNKTDKGDLDNFITGICDGLMNAHKYAHIHEEFKKKENNDIHPKEFKMITDDSHVMSICAKKIIKSNCETRYEVTISGVSE